MNTTPREETVSDEQLAALISVTEDLITQDGFHPFHVATNLVLLRELQSRRSAQPADRAAIIEECAKALDEMQAVYGRFEAGADDAHNKSLMADRAYATSLCAKEIRALTPISREEG